jgi:hypothetical protein
VLLRPLGHATDTYVTGRVESLVGGCPITDHDGADLAGSEARSNETE